jgi:hypothetical protein
MFKVCSYRPIAYRSYSILYRIFGHPVRYILLIYLLYVLKYIGSISGTGDATRMTFFELGRKSDDLGFSDSSGVPPKGRPELKLI